MSDRTLGLPTRYQPQQSALKPHSGQRQAARIRYMAALPQRSQNTASSRHAALFGAVSLVRPGSPADPGRVPFLCAMA